MRTVLMPAFAVLMAVFAASGCVRDPAAEIRPESVIRLSDAFRADFSLIDTDGRVVSDEDFRGRVMIVYFGFATCPDVCPLALGVLSAALNEVEPRGRADIAAIFITVDPERDTPDALRDFLAFDDRIVGLTGAPEAAEAARRSFKVYARRQPQEDSALGYTMDHTSLFYIVDREGRPQLAVHDTVNAQELAAILRRAVRGRLT
jgi:protein SCO1/2